MSETCRVIINQVKQKLHLVGYLLIRYYSIGFFFSTVSRLGVMSFSDYQLNAQLFYFSTICMLHYAPQHVPSSTLLILRRTNCTTTASGIVTLCKQPYSMQLESGLQSALHLHTVQLLVESDDTRGCGDTICPPEDEQRAARNMLRIVV